MSVTSVLSFLKDSADEIAKSRRQDKFIAAFTALSAVATGWTFAQYVFPRLIITIFLWIITITAYLIKTNDIKQERKLDFKIIRWRFLEKAYSEHMEIKHDVLIEESEFYHKQIWSSINSLIYFVKNFDPKTPQGEELTNKLVNSVRDGAYGLMELQKRIHSPYKEFLSDSASVEDIPFPSEDKEFKKDIEYVKDDVETFESNMASVDDLQEKLSDDD